MNNKPIIIVGGMGPQASISLHERILRESRRHHDGEPDDYPSILHLSLQIPNFIENSSNERKAISTINASLNNFSISKDTLVCLPCNTAHKLVPFMEIPEEQFVSMIDAVLAKIKKSGCKKVGLLASPNTLESGLYSDALETMGVASIVPNKRDIVRLHRIIVRVIKGDSKISDRSILSELAQKLVARGADCILLGCTELPIVGVASSVLVIDSLEELSRELISRML